MRSFLLFQDVASDRPVAADEFPGERRQPNKCWQTPAPMSSAESSKERARRR